MVMFINLWSMLKHNYT